MPTLGVVSLGCAKNLVDTEIMLGLLTEAGFTLVQDPQAAEVLLINTCGFLEAAREESIQQILELAEYKKPERGRCRLLLVTGCLVERYREELARGLPEVDAFLGTNEFPQVAVVLKRLWETKEREAAAETEKERGTLLPAGPADSRADVGKEAGAARKGKTPAPFLYTGREPRVLTTPPYLAYVKIAEGCNNCCSYCAIPAIRGPYRSRPLEEILAEVRRLVAQGVREIILIAQDTSRYGEDLYGEYALARLLRQVARVDGLVWVRALYFYPTRITPELIEVIAEEPRICKYIDLPLQHINSRILQAMRRQGSPEEIRALIGRLRRAIPELTLRTSFIVGFPREGEAEFAELLDFVQEAAFDRVGVFMYSREEGTEAAKLPGQVPRRVKEERYARLMALQQGISRARNQARCGRIYQVLIEGRAPESELVTVGRSQAEAPEVDGLIYIGNAHPPAGTFAPVKIVEAGDYDLVGEVCVSE